MITLNENSDAADKGPTKTGFREIKKEVLRRIRTQVWGPGELVPGEQELAAEFGCARATVNRAMRELSDEGIIDRRRKTGTRVRMSPERSARFEIPLVRVEIEASGATYRYALVSRDQVAAPDWLRACLGISTTAKFIHVKCVHYADGAAFQFEDRWINLAAVPQASQESFSSISPNEWLVSQVPFTEAEIRFSATRADRALADFLAMASDDPVFTVTRTTWLADKPVTLAHLYFSQGYQMVARY